MPNITEKLAFQNVISQRRKFHYKEFENVYKAFIEGIVNEGIQIKGPYFYTLNNTPFDEMVDIEMFMPVYNHFNIEGYQFHTYYEVGPLMSERLTENFENATEAVYYILIETLKQNELEIHTPFFHVPAKDGSEYIDIHVGFKIKESKKVGF